MPINLRRNIRNFEVRLGPPGGDKGYKVMMMMMMVMVMVMVRVMVMGIRATR